MRLRWLAAFGLIGLLGGCGGGTPPSPPPQPATPQPVPPPATGAKPATPPVAMPKEPELPPLPAIAYEPKGRRDPFASLAGIEGAKGLTIASVKLVGIVDGRQGRLALIEAPDGLGYILRNGDLLGDGRVVEIGRDNVTFAVSARPGLPSTRVVLRLRTE